MLIFLVTLLATVSSILRSRAALELESLALRHQIGALQRSARKRSKLILLDRLLRAWLSRVWSDWRQKGKVNRATLAVAGAEGGSRNNP